MNRQILLPTVAALAMLASSVVRAQSIPASIPASAAVPPPISDADALAAQMRIIAAQPSDIGALAQAGELSTRIGDLSGAASLFARADKIDPRNGRVKAGMAEVLLRSERPGEALRFFDQAEGYGYPATRFAAERGLAYDLVGQQGRAQRDYRQVLAAGDTPEVRRRYALSLAIAGQGEAALQELDPLIRRNDRGAWRSRAFILAMQGDVTGATTIATTMMAPGQAQGLAPFFARLASLGLVDRAFAVHFGELRPTPQRLADARLAPALSPLVPDVVQLARAAPPALPARAVDPRRRRKGGVQLAAAIPVPPPLARPPAYGTIVGAAPTTPRPVMAAITPRSSITAGGAAAVTPPPRVSGPRVAFYVPGSLMPRYAQLPRRDPVGVVSAPATSEAVPARAMPTAINAIPPSALPAIVQPQASVARVVASAAVAAAIPPTAPIVAAVVAPIVAPLPRQAIPPAIGPTKASTGLASPVPPIGAAIVGAAPVTVAAAPTPVTPAATSIIAAPSAAATTTGIVAATSEPASAGDAVLARIADALAVPGRELAAAGTGAPVTPVVTAPAPVAPAPTPVATAPTPIATIAAAPVQPTPDAPLVVNGQLTEAGRAAIARRRRAPEHAATAPTAAEPERPTRSGNRREDTAPADKPSRAARHEAVVAETSEPAPALTRSRRHREAPAAADDTSADTLTPVDRKSLARKAAADRKALADKKAAVEAKAVADKDAADERRARKSEPERYWVQVAGGANGGDLAKAWSSTRAKAPALAGRKGWSTPLRATNRVVTGPFKTDEEARAFVNTLKKQGVSAFPFTSEAGQKITRLDAHSGDK